MMTSDEKTLVPSLIKYVRSDLFTLDNISDSITLSVENDDGSLAKWDAVIKMLPLEFYRLIESYPNIYTIEKFNKKYIRNPKLCAYEQYESTNMWRPLMILNRCPTITRFNFEWIRLYNISVFSELLSVLITRAKNYDG